jgi:hypothetical protein
LQAIQDFLIDDAGDGEGLVFEEGGGFTIAKYKWEFER